MTALFDGVAGLLNDVLGGPVNWTGADIGTVSVTAEFRRVPVDVEGSGGEPVVAMQAICRIPAGILPRPPRKNDEIQPGDGKIYRLTSVQPSASPAVDRFLVCELELVP